MNILLTGSSGQLGRELLPLLRRRGVVTGLDRSVAAGDATTVQQDLADLGQVEATLKRLRPDLVVNAAAYTAVDRAEADRDAAFRVNADLPGCLAQWAGQHDALLLHYSTDYVFSGQAGTPYAENAGTGPLNVYGASKLAGESAVMGSGCRHRILRTSWVYASHGNNFVLTMLRLARERPSLNVVADQVGCPTWARNLARVSSTLLEQDQARGGGRSGLWHYCDRDALSWYDFAQAIFATARELGLLDRLPEMTAVTTAQFPQPATRPRYSVLDTSAIQADFGIEPAGLAESLRACIEDMRTHDEQR